MKTKILQFLFLCILSIYATNTQAQNLTWAKSITGTNSTGFTSISTSVATDASGNIYTTGFFGGTVDFDPGVGVFNMTAPLLDMFISKVDASGNFLWAKMIAPIPNMGGILKNVGEAIKVDASGNVYVSGFFGGINIDFNPGAGVYNLSSSSSVEDAFILKLDTNGNFIWARNMGGSGYDRAYSIAVDATGNVYTSGIFDQTADFDPGAGVFNLTSNASTIDVNDVFISKLNSAGNFVWAKKLGGLGDDQSSSIAVDATGNVYTSGIFTGTADFDPNAGVFNLTAANGTYDVNTFVSKLDASGNFVWAKVLSSSANPSSLALDASSNVYVAVRNIYKLNSSGTNIWEKSIESLSTLVIKALTVDAVGNVYTTGEFAEETDFDPSPTSTYKFYTGNWFNINAFVSKLDANGAFVWAKSLGNKTVGTDDDAKGQGIAVDVANNVVVTGEFTGMADFDPNAGVSSFTTPTPNQGQMFIVKLSQCPVRVMPVSVANGTLTIPYSQQLTQTGLTGTPIWTVTLGTLPAGLTLNASTGVIAGTPSAVGLFKFMVEVTGGSCPQTMEYSIDIVTNCPATGYITSTNSSIPTNGNWLGYAQIGVPYTITFGQTGLSGTVTWSISAGVLPQGLILSPTTGIVTGAPIISATAHNFTVRATNGTCSKEQIYDMDVVCGYQVFATSSTLQYIYFGVPFTFNAGVVDGPTPKTYSITPALPLGLSMDLTTGLITGTPATLTGGSYTITSTHSSGSCPMVKVLGTDLTQNFFSYV